MSPDASREDASALSEGAFEDAAAEPSRGDSEKEARAGRQFPCPQCGATMTYAVGLAQTQCAHCGHAAPVPDIGFDALAGALAERDLERWLERAEREQSAAPSAPSREIHCDGCGARVALGPHDDASRCPYCGKGVVVESITTRTLAVQALLPFSVDRERALRAWRNWLGSLWFAPGSLKRMAGRDAALDGVYLPHWTYDAVTHTDYAGERGDYYYVDVSAVVRENGRARTVTRRERRIRWRPAAGRARVDFDDVLVPATRTLSRELARGLPPWDLSALVPYAPDYLAGFKAERHQVGLREGFEEAKALMRPEIERAIRADIGGDEQRIGRMRTAYRDATFKHILLPAWISGYRFGGKVYQFCVNGRTGSVRGQRPWSWAKIAAAVIAGLAVAGLILRWLVQSGAFDQGSV